MRRSLSVICALVVLAAQADRAEARMAPHEICDAAAARVASETDVPLSVLRAISLTETGRKKGGQMTTWPWTVNMEGVGKWFDDRDEALSYAYKNFKRGARSFDIGCFQINFKWHGEHFASIDEMFDPLANARYAARFLTALHDELGDWTKAAGAFHSRTEKYASKYRARFAKFRANLPDAPAGGPLPDTPPLLAAATPGAIVPQAPRVNNYSLLQNTPGQRAIGSLVPLGGNAQPFIAAGS